MTENERQQRMAERILEDERLRGDLEDGSAAPLIEWASARAAAAAADPARPDEEVEAEVQAVRQATRTAVRSGETDPNQLIALATDALRAAGVLVPGPQAVPVTTPPVASEASVAQPATTLSASEPTSVAAQPIVTDPVANTAPAATAPAISATPTEQPSVETTPTAEEKPTGTSRWWRRRHRLIDYFKRVRGGR